MKKGILFALIGVFAIGLSAGAAFFFLMGDQAPAEEQPEALDTAPKAQYFNLRPPVVVNLLAGSRQRMLQADLVLVARNEDAIAAVMRHEPMLRSRIINFFSDLETQYIQTPTGKLEILDGLTETINDGLQSVAEPARIEGVLFNNLVMQ